MNTLTPSKSQVAFSYDGTRIRACVIDAQIWLVTEDIFRVLGLASTCANLNRIEDCWQRVEVFTFAPNDYYGGSLMPARALGIINTLAIFQIAPLADKAAVAALFDWVVTTICPLIETRLYAKYIEREVQRYKDLASSSSVKPLTLADHPRQARQPSPTQQPPLKGDTAMINVSPMTPMIAITQTAIGEGSVPTVNARDLHAFLEVGKDYSNWIKYQIGTFGFEVDCDYVVLAQNGDQYYQGVSLKKDYFLTLDMAKEVAMLSRCAKGKQARQYFIECERKAQQAPSLDPMRVLNDPEMMRQLLLGYSEKVIALESKIEERRADSEALERIAKADGSLCMTDSAKVLQQRPRDLVDYLKAHKWIYRRTGTDHWVGYQSHVQAGDVEHKVTTVLRSDGTERITEQVRITPQGLTKLAKLFPPIAKIA